MNVVKNTLAAALLLTVAVGTANDFGKKGIAKNEMVKKMVELENDPTFKRKGDKLYINLLNLDQEKVTIRVRDSWGRVVFSEVIKGEMIIEKAFNFENAFEDEYTVEVVDNSTSYKEVVAIN